MPPTARSFPVRHGYHAFLCRPARSCSFNVGGKNYTLTITGTHTYTDEEEGNTGQEKVTATYSRPLADCPLPRPRNWVDLVNQPQSESELAALRHCVQRDCPYGTEAWAATTAKQL